MTRKGRPIRRRVGRLFPDFPPLYVDPRDLAAIADKNSPMKSIGPAQKTSSVPVGHISFGQFIDHDITLDLSSSFARLDSPESTPNARTPTLDLDSIYGAGRQVQADKLGPNGLFTLLDLLSF